MSELINIKEIFDNGSIYHLLQGEDGLNLVNIHSDMPTNPVSVIQQLAGFIETADAPCEKWKIVEAGLLELSKSMEGTWLLCYYMLNLTRMYNNYNFECIDFNLLLTQLNQSIEKFKPYLKFNKKWTGTMYEDGLWGDITRLTRLMNSDLNIQT